MERLILFRSGTVEEIRALTKRPARPMKGVMEIELKLLKLLRAEASVTQIEKDEENAGRWLIKKEHGIYST